MEETEVIMEVLGLTERDWVNINLIVVKNRLKNRNFNLLENMSITEICQAAIEYGKIIDHVKWERLLKLRVKNEG